MEVKKDIFDKLIDMVILFTKNNTYELEGKYKDIINKENFTNLIQYARSNFKEEIQPEVLDISAKTDEGIYRISLKGKEAIREYCKTNILQESLLGNNLEVIIKKPVIGVYPILLNDINFKIDLKQETPVPRFKVSELLKQLPLLDKGYRFKTRFSYIQENTNLRLDMTIVKTSKLIGKEITCHKNLIESQVTQSYETYEVEVELLRKQSSKDTEKKINEFLKSMITIYTVIQNEINMMSKTDKENVIKNYLKLCFGPNGQIPPKKKNKDFSMYEDSLRNPKTYFFGPQPITLERKNIIPPELGVVTIVEDYTVTDKADGERCLIFVNNNGKCYLINNRLNIQYTGIQINGANNTIIDGEHVTKDILGNPISLYAAFDIYFNNGTDVRSLELISSVTSQKTRYKIMKEFETKYSSKLKEFFDFKVKEFLFGSNIFELSLKMYERQKIATLPYHIDGLIYTPVKLAVGTSFENDIPNNIGSWSRVFKWKPADENTIDFLVRYDKDSYGKLYKILKGSSEFRLLNLYVGYNPISWNPITAYNYLTRQLIRENGYYERLFNPPDVIDENFSKCEAELLGNKIVCLNGDEIDDRTIVEFSYNINDNKWVPLRVRKDKTEMLRKAGLSNTANDYGTALNVWRSIQEPVTINHITGKLLLKQSDIKDEDIYYSRSIKRDKMASRNMMNFHNWIKNNQLIAKTKGKTLIDLACGPGGDLGKWIENGFIKVFGVDIFRDNIENPVNGIYARTYENFKKPKNSTFAYLTMDSSKVLNSEYIDELKDEKDKYVAQVLWGDIDKAAIKEPFLKEYHGYVNQKFDVVSCQFAIHYFFESETKLDNFVENVDMFIKENGYFIGTCLDGSSIKQKLKFKKFEEEITGKLNNRVIWNIKKLYKEEKKKKIGEQIEIYMESIGRRIKEYLVNMDILINKFKKYDIHLVQMNNFGSVYDQSEKNMTDVESEYSFMNIFFKFKKGDISNEDIKVEMEIEEEDYELFKEESEPEEDIKEESKVTKTKKIKVSLKKK